MLLSSVSAHTNVLQLYNKIKAPQMVEDLNAILLFLWGPSLVDHLFLTISITIKFAIALNMNV